jgi:hypothetical protein
VIKWKALTDEERSQLVAEKIMGWTPESRCHITQDEREIIWGDDLARCKRCGHINWDDRMQTHTTAVLPYTTSLDAAWKVAEQMSTRTEGYPHPAVLFLLDLRDQMEWRHRDIAWIFTQLTPEKVCVTALRAIGVEIEE